VGLHVRLVSPGMCETHATHIADIRPLARVHTHVGLQVARHSECLVAHRATPRLQTEMYGINMPPQTMHVLEPRRAFRAHVRTVRRMGTRLVQFEGT